MYLAKGRRGGDEGWALNFDVFVAPTEMLRICKAKSNISAKDVVPKDWILIWITSKKE